VVVWRGTVVGVASWGGGRWLAVWEVRTRRRGARVSMAAEQGSATWWLDGVGTRRRSGGNGWEEGCSWGGGGGWALFIAGRGSGWRRRGGESGGGEMTAGNQRCQRCCGSDRLPMVCASERQLSGWWARSILTGWVGTVDMSWVQSGAQPFSNYSNFAPNFQIQNEDYPDVHKCSNLAWC
jgi:hypothetical protein